MLCCNVVIKWSIFFVDVGFYHDLQECVWVGRFPAGLPLCFLQMMWFWSVWNCPKLSYLCLIVACRCPLKIIAWKGFFNKHKKWEESSWDDDMREQFSSKKKDIFNSITLHVNALVVLERHKRACCCQRLTWWDVTVRELQFNSTTNISTQGLHSVHSTHNITAQVFFCCCIISGFF